MTSWCPVPMLPWHLGASGGGRHLESCLRKFLGEVRASQFSNSRLQPTPGSFSARCHKTLSKQSRCRCLAPTSLHGALDPEASCANSRSLSATNLCFLTSRTYKQARRNCSSTLQQDIRQHPRMAASPRDRPMAQVSYTKGTQPKRG